MDRIITCGFADNFIEKLADRLLSRHCREGNDLGRTAVVFGGHRPALFLKRELGRRIGRGFHPPRFFSMDEFMQYVVSKKETCGALRGMDACHLLYLLAKTKAPGITEGRDTFSAFLPWAREIAAFIDQCDLEAVEDAALRNVQSSAEIGYDVPESVNSLLESIISLRRAYHGALRERKTYSRGFAYLRASMLAGEAALPEFESVLFCNFFYMHKTEEAVIKSVYDGGKGVLFFQCDRSPWLVFDRLSRIFSRRISPDGDRPPSFRLHLAAGMGPHAQVGLVREALEKTANHDETVIVLPDSGSLIPLLSEIGPRVKELNVSMGYPLVRNPSYSLLESILGAQRNRSGDVYYARDYLKVITHPLMKNMNFMIEPAVTRVLVHKVEEALSGAAPAPIGGSLFLSLSEIEECAEIFRLTAATLGKMGIDPDAAELPALMRLLHDAAFRPWETVKTPRELADAVERFIGVLAAKSSLPLHFLNVKGAEQVLATAGEMRDASFADEEFERDGLFKIFMEELSRGKVSFGGSPLKGLQVLGLFETRALNFKNVIIMDVNESALPALRTAEPLIPRQVMIGLGLNRVEEEEEIQRYHFRRLISHARDVHLIYDDRMEKERSRFIEELVWERQKREKSVRRQPVRRAGFPADIAPRKGMIPKSPDVERFLSNFDYSPSSIDAYLACPAGFYFRHVLGLKEREDLLWQPELSEVGIFLHRLLGEAFSGFKGRRPALDPEFRAFFMGLADKRLDDGIGRRMGPDLFLFRRVMRHRLKRFLDREAARDALEIISLEEEFRGVIESGGRGYRFVCRVDRIDRLPDGGALVVDYKTGSGIAPPRSSALLTLEQSSREAIRDAVRSFQLPLYCHFAGEKYKGIDITAALYSLKTLDMAEFPAHRDRDKAGEIMEKCMDALRRILSEINDPAVPFAADERDRRRCSRCAFSLLCR